jgi:hypothetical protein
MPATTLTFWPMTLWITAFCAPTMTCIEAATATAINDAASVDLFMTNSIQQTKSRGGERLWPITDLDGHFRKTP